MKLSELGKKVNERKVGVNGKERDVKFLSKMSSRVNQYLSGIAFGEIEKGSTLTKKLEIALDSDLGFEHGKMVYSLSRLGVILNLKTDLNKKRCRSYIYRMVAPNNIEEIQNVVEEFKKVFPNGGIHIGSVPYVLKEEEK